MTEPTKTRRLLRLPQVPLDRYDLLFFGGLGLLGFGLWEIYPPATYLVVGLVLMVVGAAGARQ